MSVVTFTASPASDVDLSLASAPPVRLAPFLDQPGRPVYLTWPSVYGDVWSPVAEPVGVVVALHAAPTAGLSLADLLSGYENPGWLGFGYLGGRRAALDGSDPECPPVSAEVLGRADAYVLDRARVLGWSLADLFAWSNSREGRWFADAAFSGSTLTEAWVPGLFV